VIVGSAKKKVLALDPKFTLQPVGKLAPELMREPDEVRRHNGGQILFVAEDNHPGENLVVHRFERLLPAAVTAHGNARGGSDVHFRGSHRENDRVIAGRRTADGEGDGQHQEERPWAVEQVVSRRLTMFDLKFNDAHRL
jgi:hypothetical protein